MAILTRNSVMAVMEETTEGTPVIPSGASDYVAMQDDAEMTSTFDQIDNNELRSSIGQAASIQGAEDASWSFSHYLRHSGVEGQAPNYRKFPKGVFGSETVNGTEYDTVSSSTTSVIKVNTGEGAQFQRGQALLIKDATNGYSIRPIYSISGDNLTLGFNVAVAPASGVNLGKAIVYAPADTGHKSFTIWRYVGNGGATEMLAGTKITSLSADIAAGDVINASYDSEALAYYFDPINILSTDRYLDFTDDNGTFAAAIPAQMYRSPHAVASALQAAMLAADPLETFTVTYSDTTGKFTIATSTSTLLSLLWNTGTNTANTIGDKIGFSTAANDTGSTSYVSDNAQSFASPYTPSLDTASPNVAKYNQVLFGDATDTTCFAASSINFTVTNTRQVIESICAETGRSGSLITGREATVNVTALLTQYEAKNFERFRNGSTVRFAFNFGPKDSAGNWVPGSCGCFFIPDAIIDTFDLVDQDGLAALSMSLRAYVATPGQGEVFLNFV